MAGHSKWANIKHKKAAADAKRGKVFTMHAKLISIAAKSGGDPEMNPALRAAIDRAKADNVPNANIDRAIKKGTGEDKDGANYEAISYEAMGPGGSSFMIDVITDNKNRSNTNVKTILNKNGGSQGSTAWKFDRMAFFLVNAGDMERDEAELTLIDCGALDIEEDNDDNFVLFADLSTYGEVKKSLKDSGFQIKKDEVVWKAKNDIPIDNVDTAKKILRLIEALEEDDDVNNVYTDADISESVLAELD